MQGGCLRCYLEQEHDGNPSNSQKATGEGAAAAADGAPRVQDVVPSGGRLVLFDSKAILHEVGGCDLSVCAPSSANARGKQNSSIYPHSLVPFLQVLPSHEGARRHALTVWISDRAARWAAW